MHQQIGILVNSGKDKHSWYIRPNMLKQVFTQMRSLMYRNSLWEVILNVCEHPKSWKRKRSHNPDISRLLNRKLISRFVGTWMDLLQLSIPVMEFRPCQCLSYPRAAQDWITVLTYICIYIYIYHIYMYMYIICKFKYILYL